MDTQYENKDIYDEMSTMEWMQKMEAENMREDAVIAGDNMFCPQCGEHTYITTEANGPDDFDVIEFCVKHGILYKN